MDDSFPNFFEGEEVVDTLYWSSLGDGNPMGSTSLEVTRRSLMLAAKRPPKTSISWHMVGGGPLAKIPEKMHFRWHEELTWRWICWALGAGGFATSSNHLDLVLDLHVNLSHRTLIPATDFGRSHYSLGVSLPLRHKGLCEHSLDTLK